MQFKVGDLVASTEFYSKNIPPFERGLILDITLANFIKVRPEWAEHGGDHVLLLEHEIDYATIEI
jgi:hypothetical protein